MSNRLFCISVLVLTLATAQGLAQRAPAIGQQTTISDETLAAATDLTAAQQAEVDNVIALWINRMTAEPADATVVKSVRVTVITTWGNATGDGFKRYFATQMGEKFVPATLKKELSPIVLVNAALAIAMIDQPEIAPKLALMLTTHPNPAVRYYAAKGFARTAGAILARGSNEPNSMFTALAKAAGTERNPSVIRALAQALSLGSAGKADPSILGAARSRSRQILAALAARRLQAVRDGDLAMTDAFSYVVQALAATSAGLSAENRAAPLQTVADIMANVSKSYYDAAIQTDSSGRERVSEPPAAMSMLLVYCERAIGDMLGQKNSAVSRAIAANPQKSDVLKLQLAVNALVGTASTPGKLASEGVTAPTVLDPTPPADTNAGGG